MLIITWFLVGALLRRLFPLLSFGNCFDTSVLHGTNALFVQVFFNLVVINTINSNLSPKFLEFVINLCVGSSIIQEKNLFLVNGSHNVHNVIGEHL